MASRALGRYELVRPLARGGMAEVFLARRRAAGVEKLLVVKRIRPERSGDVRFLDLFQREAKLSMSLTHQNIVQVFDFGRAGEQVFLAMERVEGKDLGSSLARAERKPPAPLIAAFLAAECCQALDYAHGRKRSDGASLGIVHRDVTPRNVLLSWSGEVKLTDFGIASLAGDDTSRLVGTPAYMAPEQARGEPLDLRCDIYSIGLVLREALTGVRARAGEDRDALVAAARTGELSPWTGDPPAELVAIADRATALLPADRYPDAHAMLADLDTYIVAERAAHRGDPPARQLASWLAAVWGVERNERDDVTDPAIAGDEAHLVSFMDDGADGAIGTGTERSLAATAADDGPPPAEKSAPPAKPEPAPVADAPYARPEQSKRNVIIVPLAVAAVSIFLAVVATRKSNESTPDAAVVAVADAAVIDSPTPDTAPVIADAAIVVDAFEPPLDAAVRPPRPGSGSGTRPPRPGSGSGSAKPGSGSAIVVEKRKVTINATPWAYFTVDGGPRYQTPKQVELAPGPHRVHFENPVLKKERDITLDVPADRDISWVEPL